MKKTVKKLLQLYERTLALIRATPKPVFSRLGNAIQMVGAGQLTAATIGFAVAGGAISNTEALKVAIMGVAFLLCGTIIDAHSQQKK